MKEKLKGKHFISTQDWSEEELETLFNLAGRLKREYAAGKHHDWLKGKSLGMIFSIPRHVRAPHLKRE